MVKAAKSAFRDVDVILWLVEASEYVGRTDQDIARQLQGVNLPIVLAINKIDTVERDEVFKVIAVYKELLAFSEIVPVSALTGKNTDELLKVLFDYLPYGVPFYDEDTITDQPERAIAAEMIREKALQCLNEEIPHGIAVTIEQMTYGERLVDIDATIICEKDSHKGIVIGKQGRMLKKIGSAARFEIERLLERQVNLKLWVRVKKDWRDSEVLLKNYGYGAETLRQTQGDR